MSELSRIEMVHYLRTTFMVSEINSMSFGPLENQLSLCNYLMVINFRLVNFPPMGQQNYFTGSKLHLFLGRRFLVSK